MRDETLQFRIEGKVAERLRSSAKQNSRTMADELRAASEAYLVLRDLAQLRAETGIAGPQRAEIERRLKETFGRIVAAAISEEAENQFENDLEVEYPRNAFGSITMPFDRLLDWIAAGKPIT